MFTSWKKALAVGAVLALSVGGTAACNRGTQSAPGAGTGASSGKVVLALSTQTNPFFIQLRDGATAKAKELGVQLDVQDASDDPATQVNQLNNAVTAGAKVVIVNPTDSDAVTPAVKALNTAKIPVIAVDRGVNNAQVASFISSDNVAGGKQAADALAKAIGEKGDVILLQGIPGSSASRDRGQGFTDGISAYPNIKVVAKQTASFDRAKALDVATNLMQANPNVKAIFAENDEMALGAIEALGAKAGKDVKVVGFDGTADGLAAIQKGTLAATIAQQPAQLGSLAVEQAKTLLDGGQATAQIPVPVVTVTTANLADFKK
ncbi:D-ribose ABC transporter substrate-binding protein [Raineyella sp.]|uniref:D-ribose ABC transporter substrate-binding protein n=1 Tax=Raineyella sp. TaxID=1911550 RepID=UPI002B1EE0ED|nr:D-ribose ABC transporter substrate-binding protein [Raineyella sp.]MEA5155252.1 D-ribose ABC transporter substrate-binding protein [Raineyella sp.]